MSRSLNSPVDNERSEYVYLFDIEYSGGTIYLNTGSTDIDYGGNTYVAASGTLIHDSIEETSDRKAQQVRLQLWGVDQSIISTILSENFRGRSVVIRLLHIDPDTGVIGTPDELFIGKQNGDYTVRENRDETGAVTGTVTVETRIKSAIGSLYNTNSVRSNVLSHQEMLRRAGISPTNDTMFERVPDLVATSISWGVPVPHQSIGGGSSWGLGGRLPHAQ